MLRVLVNAVGWFAALVPRRGWLALGVFVGWCWFYLVRVRRRHTLAHIEHAGLSGWSPRRRRQIARGAFVTQTCNTFEMLAWRRLERARGEVPWIEIEGWEHLEAARAQGKGALILTAHVGNFDLLACQQAASGQPLHVISKRLSWAALNRAWMETRARLGLSVLPPDAPLKPALEALRAGDIVALVLDQHSPEPRAVERPFLGIPARSSAALATLAVRSKAPIVPCFTVRLKGGRHRIWFEPPIPLPTEGRARARIEETTARCLRVIERVVLEHPEQWLWLHRRWKDAERRPLIQPGQPRRASLD